MQKLTLLTGHKISILPLENVVFAVVAAAAVFAAAVVAVVVDDDDVDF